RAEAVGQPGARRNEDRDRDQVGRDARGDRNRGRAKTLGDLRDGRRDDGAVQDLHKERRRDDQGEQGGTWLGRRRGVPFCFWFWIASAPGKRWWGRQDSNLRSHRRLIYSQLPLPLGTLPRCANRIKGNEKSGCGLT